MIIRDLLTEDDGISYCWAKCASSVALCSYIITAQWALWHATPELMNQLFSSFGQNLAVILGGCGALIAAKQATQQKYPAIPQTPNVQVQPPAQAPDQDDPDAVPHLPEA